MKQNFTKNKTKFIIASARVFSGIDNKEKGEELIDIDEKGNPVEKTKEEKKNSIINI